MAQVTKRVGAPAGTVKVSVSEGTFTFDDGANLILTVSESAAGNLITHPYLRLVSGGGVYVPPAGIQDVFLADGVLSYGSQNLPTARESVRSLSDDGTRWLPDPSGSDDTGPLMDRLAQCEAWGSGSVGLRPKFDAGPYLIQPDEVVIPATTLLRGHALGVSEVRKLGNGVGIDISGTDETTGRKQRAQLQGLRVHGGNFSGAAIRAYYVSQAHMRDVEVAFNADVNMDFVSAWDTNVDGYFLDWGGKADGSVPVLWVRNSAASSGFGTAASTQTNMVSFSNGRIESFRGLPFRFERGTGSTSDPYGIYVERLKTETAFLRAGMGYVSNVRECTINNWDVSPDSFDAGFSTPQIGLFWAPVECGTISNVRLHQTANFVSQLVQASIPANGAFHIGRMSADPSGVAPGTALINWSASGPCYYDDSQLFSAGTVHSGTPPKSATVASSSPLTLPRGAEFVTVTLGSTPVTSIGARAPGTRVTLYCSGAVGFTDGGNLRLAGDLTAGAGKTLSLISDGTNWTETARTAT